LINRVVPQDQLLAETELWCEQIKGFSGQTIRSTKKSLNFESDMLYASWQHGMELLAEIWGSEEGLEGMNAFLEKRKPDFMQFRNKRQESVQTYLDTIASDGNRAPRKS
jgi:1,4-dihydroxy-2-naphthoyl-CoA synthase